MTVNGEVDTPLDESDVRRAIDRLKSQGVEAVAVAFPHASVNPDHERRAVALVRAALPDVPVCASSAVLPEIRGYERWLGMNLSTFEIRKRKQAWRTREKH